MTAFRRRPRATGGVTPPGFHHKRDALLKLYRHDNRVAPWAGTAQGKLQAVNTAEHHEGTVRGPTRAERNMLRTVTGDFGDVDRGT
jgi:hypothetical protein